MDNMRLNTLNLLTRLLNAFETDELNIIQHSTYMSDTDFPTHDLLKKYHSSAGKNNLDLQIKPTGIIYILLYFKALIVNTSGFPQILQP